MLKVLRVIWGELGRNGEPVHTPSNGGAWKEHPKTEEDSTTESLAVVKL